MKGKQRDHGYEAYMQEVHRYLGQVDRGRRVAGNDPLAHRFSQAVDDQRQAARAGIPYQAPPQATAPYSKALSPQYGFLQGQQPAQGVPTPQQEELQDPLFTPSDVGQSGLAALKSLFAMKSLIPLMGAMRQQGNRALPGYIPPEYNLEKHYSRGTTLKTGDQWMQEGIDPTGLTGQWSETGQGMFDYLPRGVRTREQASRWLQHKIGDTRPSADNNFRDDLIPGELGFTP